jgi:hypothetical protein
LGKPKNLNVLSVQKKSTKLLAAGNKAKREVRSRSGRAWVLKAVGSLWMILIEVTLEF